MYKYQEESIKFSLILTFVIKRNLKLFASIRKMKSVYIAVLLSALVFVSMLTDVSACELRRRGDCCFNNGFKCCIVNNSGRQSCKQSFGKILKLNEFKDYKNSI